MKTEAEIKKKGKGLWDSLCRLQDERDRLATIHALDRYHALYIAQECGELRAKSVALNWVLGEFGGCETDLTFAVECGILYA